MVWWRGPRPCKRRRPRTSPRFSAAARICRRRVLPAPIWLPAEKAGRNMPPWAFTCPGIRWTIISPPCGARAMQTLAEVTAAAQDRGAWSRPWQGTVGASAGKEIRAAPVCLCRPVDPTAFTRVTVFSDTLDAHRQHLEPTGENVVLQVQVEPSGEQVKAAGARVTPWIRRWPMPGANRLAVDRP